jgi:hypothetical protein
VRLGIFRPSLNDLLERRDRTRHLIDQLVRRGERHVKVSAHLLVLFFGEPTREFHRSF